MPPHYSAINTEVNLPDSARGPCVSDLYPCRVCFRCHEQRLSGFPRERLCHFRGVEMPELFGDSWETPFPLQRHAVSTCPVVLSCFPPGVTSVETQVSEMACGRHSCDICQGLATISILHVHCRSEVGF